MNHSVSIYLVGGAVRDQLLNRPVKERDWVVVGATPEYMSKLGYKPVGKDFPVFLHPETHEEYALARTEKKTKKGYQGFSFYTDPSVTLEQDLQRRDLTINAIAQDSNGTLYDPYHGVDDIEQRVFRHVSEAFSEDPVRILRLARFTARFNDFHIHQDTLKLAHDMVQNGEVDALVSERVFQELNKALNENHPERFFQTLEQTEALSVIFPSFNCQHIDQNALNHIISLSQNPALRFAILSKDQKADTTTTILKKLKAPKAFLEYHLLLSKITPLAHSTLDAESLMKIIELSDGIRRENRFDATMQLLEAVGIEKHHIEKIKAAQKKLKNLDLAPVLKAGHEKKDLAQAIRQYRLQQLAG